MKKNIFLLAFVSLILLAGCVPTTFEEKADGRGWYVTVTEYRYSSQAERSGWYGGSVSGWHPYNMSAIPGTGDPSLDIASLVETTGCSTTKPGYPSLNDRYCVFQGPLYYLVFGEQSIQVSKETWDGYTADTVYTLQETGYGLELVSDR